MLPPLNEEESKVFDFNQVQPIPERKQMPGQVHEDRRMEQYEVRQMEDAKKNESAEN